MADALSHAYSDFRQETIRGRLPMFRRLYQVTLVALQIALVVQIAPPLAQSLQRGAAFGAFAHGPLAALQVACAVAAIVGAALALAFPGFALLRHRQRGVARFGGLPRWCVALAVAGAGIFLAGSFLYGMVSVLPRESRLATALTARPVMNAGLALMAAGVMCAECLRRSVGVPRIVVVAREPATGRIEVTHPPELATRLA
jgi:hypothetical protein